MNAQEANVDRAKLISEVGQLRRKVADLEAQLRTRCRSGDTDAAQSIPQASASSTESNHSSHGTSGRLPGWQGVNHSLNKDQIERYSRQILLRSFGVEGKIAPKSIHKRLRVLGRSLWKNSSNRICCHPIFEDSKGERA